MKNVTALHNTKIFSIPESIRNDSGKIIDVLKIISHVYEINIEILEKNSFKIFGSDQQIQIVSSLIQSIFASMMDNENTAVDHIILSGTLDDFLNSTEPTSNALQNDTKQIDQAFGYQDEEQLTILGQNTTANNDPNAEEVKNTGRKNKTQHAQAKELNDPLSGDETHLFSSGASFQKPTLNNSRFFADNEIISYKPLFPASSKNAGFNPFPSTISISEDTLTPNTPPIAADDEIFVNEGKTVSIYSQLLLNDLDTDALNILSVKATGLHGLITFDPAARILTYEAGAYFNSFAAGETLTEFFTYTISDGRGGVFTAQVTVTVTGVNDAPIAQDDVASIGDDTTIITGNVMSDNGNGTDSDVDTSDVLRITAVSGGSVGAPTAGSTGGLFTINSNGAFTFNPNGDFAYLAVGETEDTTVTYTINDGNGGTDTATFTVTVTGVNDIPVAQNDDITTDENTVYSGSVFVNNGNGADSDADTNDTITVTTIMGGTVGAPTAGSAGGQFTLNADGTLSFNPNGDFKYLAAGESLDTTLTYTIDDGNGGTDTATVTMTVTGVNDAPIAQNDAITTNENTVYSGSVFVNNGNGADSDIDTSDVITVTAIAGGTVGTPTAGSAGGLFTLNANGTLSFNPNGDFEYLAVGESLDTTITYTIDDGNGGTDTATVTMTVTGVNDAPVAQNDLALINDDSTIVTGNVMLDNGNGADSDVDTTDILTITGVSGGSVGAPTAGSAGGLFTINSDGSYTFDPNGDFAYLAIGETQNTTVTYTLNDGNGGTDTATVTVTVTGVNDAFTGNTDNITINENALLSLHATLLANDTDIV